jgi:hypothetical protein
MPLDVMAQTGGKEQQQGVRMQLGQREQEGMAAVLVVQVTQAAQWRAGQQEAHQGLHSRL